MTSAAGFAASMMVQDLPAQRSLKVRWKKMASLTSDQSDARQLGGAPQRQGTRHQRRYLRTLIKEASRGESGHVRALLRPFISADEELMSWGIGARMGVIPRYNFYFLTDRRVGDLDVTPFTGNLQVEMAFLHKIDAVVINQPSMVGLRCMLVLLYLLPIVGGPLGASAVLGGGGRSLALALAVAAVGALLVHVVLSPMLTRAALRFRKSGMFLKLAGGPVGTFIFADRTKMMELSNLSRRIADLKRQLDLAD